MSNRRQERYEFGPFQLHTAERCLFRDGQPVPLTPKVFDLLEVLVRNGGHLVEKEELLRQVWADSFVEEGNLNRNISILRKVLGDTPSGQTYIETVPKRGYRFTAPLRQLIDAESNITEQVTAEPKRTLAPSFAARSWRIFAILAVIALGGTSYVASKYVGPAERPEIKSLAVLAFQNLSGDPDQDYFADGMTEALITNLAQIRALRVPSRTSVMTLKGSKKLLPELARELDVDAVVEGSVQRDKGRLKVTVQLVHAATDGHLWARTYEREVTDVLNLQSEMARAIADEIRIQVTPDELVRMASVTTVNSEAHEEYLRGRYHLHKYIIEDHKKAIAHFERAIQLNPKYAAAYAGLSQAWWNWGFQGPASLKDVESPARVAARKALELDDRLSEAYVAHASIQFLYDWDWRAAENSLRRALELDINNLDAHLTYSNLLIALGRFPEATAQLQIAEKLDPVSAPVQSWFGVILVRTGKLDEAIHRLNRAIGLEPRSALAHHRLAVAYEQMGRYEEALALYDKARELRGNKPSNRTFQEIVAGVYARMGKHAEAKRIIEQLGGDVPAGLYAALGEKDKAFAQLFKMVEERENVNIYVKHDSGLVSLHSDPRWLQLMNRMNFPAE